MSVDESRSSRNVRPLLIIAHNVVGSVEVLLHHGVRRTVGGTGLPWGPHVEWNAPPEQVQRNLADGELMGV